MRRQHHIHRNWFCRWFIALLGCWAPLAGNAQGIIPPPTMVEITALSGQTRLGPIEGGVTMAVGGKYYVTARPGNGQPATIRAWNNNDTVLWSYGLAGDDTLLVPMLGTDGTKLFIGTEGGKLFCLDALTGSSLWGGASGINLGFKVRAQPALSPDGTILYVRTANGKLHARKTSDGSAYWTVPAELSDTLPPTQSGHSNPLSPGPVVVNDNSGFGKVYAATADGRILGFTTVGSAASPIFTLDLRTSPWVTAPYSAAGNTGTPAVAIEASPALGTNNWLYVGTRNFTTVANTPFQVIAAVNLANPPASAVQWVQPVGSDDNITIGMIAAPVLDRAGYVYATEFGHHVEQFDARFGTKQRVWTSGQISGKLCQTPALTEDGLLLLAQSGAGNTGFARFAAYRTYGLVSVDESSLWQTASLQLDLGSSAPDFFGAPAVAANGRIYVADTLGRVLRFNGTTPLMEGQWPTLGGGNRHSATPLSYAWNIVQLLPAPNLFGATATINSIDNANRTLGHSYGDYAPNGISYFGSVWNPLYATRFNTFPSEAIFGSTAGDVVGLNLTTSRALIWPLGAFNSAVAAVTLPLPLVTAFGGGSVTVNASYATGIAEDGVAYGYVNNSTVVTVASVVSQK